MNYLCGTTLVLPVGQHSYARYRADPAQPTLGENPDSVRSSEVIQADSCLLPCTIRQLSGGGGYTCVSSS